MKEKALKDFLSKPYSAQSQLNSDIDKMPNLSDIPSPEAPAPANIPTRQVSLAAAQHRFHLVQAEIALRIGDLFLFDLHYECCNIIAKAIGLTPVSGATAAPQVSDA